jgi:hypothetical protein
MSKLLIKEIFRYGRPYSATPETIGNVKNHFAASKLDGAAMVLLEKGISPIAAVKAKDGKRTPVIIIRSSPHKIGSETTPWQDVFDIDNGHIRYYGDNKEPGQDAAAAPGNKALLEAFERYNDGDHRDASVPLLFYKAVSRNGSAKGYIQFNGFGIITGVELITQYDRKLDRTFSNYAFNFHVFSLAKDNEQFDWRWINDRRDNTLTLDETLRYAPASWKQWMKEGNKALEKTRRRVSKLLVVSKEEQVPIKGSQEEKILIEVYKYYHQKKAIFEGLAAEVAAKIFRQTVGRYKAGWITPSTSDGGADFYGRVDLGAGFGRAKLIVLGQAKCESLNTPTNGNHIARTVARLRRGWVGAYVTTSYFSEAAQREVIEDEYPIMLVNGKRLAETILTMLHDEGYSSLTKLLDELEAKYKDLVQIRKPDELLFE